LQESPRGILSDRKAILERWNQYFKELYDKDKNKGEEQRRLMEATEVERNLTTEELESRTPTTEEVKQASNKLKNSRAPESDSINAELLKDGNTVITEKIHNIMERVWKTEEISQKYAQYFRRETS
jgi:uncharacterized membrane-anchored protein